MTTARREHGETLVTRTAPNGDVAEPTRALAVLQRHAWLAGAVFLVVLAGAATSAMSLPDIYRSTATVLVEHPGTTEGVGKSLIAGELETRLQTIGQEVLSQARLTALMDRFDLYPELRAHGAHAAAVAAVLLADQFAGSFHPLEELRAFTNVPVLASIPRIGVARPNRQPRWLTAAPIAVGLVLVVLVSYHLASGNDQLAFLFSRTTP